MTQDQWIALAFKVVLISGFVALTAWVAVYIRLTRGAALKDPIGQTLIAKSLLLAAVLVPSTLSLFFTFSRWSSHLAGWIDVVLIGAITPVMWWRIAVWLKIHRSNAAARPDPDTAEKAERHHPVRADPAGPAGEAGPRDGGGEGR